MSGSTISHLRSLQNSFNEFISEDWTKSRTSLDFKIALTQEVAELIDSTHGSHGMGWKWWKGKSGERTTDSIVWSDIHPKVVDNIKIELTDCLFFALSQSIIGGTIPEPIVHFSDNDWVNITNISKHSLNDHPDNVIQLIIYLAGRLEFNIGAYYIAKYTLNHIRQLSGYKNGTYQKVIDGVEDNEVLHDIIKDITSDDLDLQFSSICDRIMSGVYTAFKVPRSDWKMYSDWVR